ncbi:MAG: ABC transporter ATP-binding protein [archaeon YNP-LCB-003-016]|uniref:ABC transporter ATP-binding protein n=1 Tax=Candidatus Culexarchaeum yellowstonense TaxID=2928963 RepID=UPI0026ED6834|nr:ABC transporter ATP-binding protein [Candidatus Culexarchaeum yellowstonense]MCR6692349.1 ABC transporter ATP-binding protein [Candidatus Culexarchaeum yellowstonense]
MLVVQGVKKYFGGLKAVDGVNLKAERRKITLLIGPNGSGKTTLINVITGYLKPDGGKVYFEGEDITGLPMNKIYEKNIIRTFQIPSLFPSLTVLENLLVAGRGNPGEYLMKCLNRGKWIEYEENLVKKAMEVMRTLNIIEFWNTPVTALPAGHLKLVEIGRALMADAKMAILDEPIGGVSPKLANEIFLLFRKLRDERGLTFLIIEHRLDIALKFADYVYVMHNGKIISEGVPQQIVGDSLVKKVYMGE